MTVTTVRPRPTPATRRRRSRASGPVPALLALYLAPMFALGRTWASVGASPLYLPDLLAVTAALAAIPTLNRQLSRNRALRRYALTVAVLAVLVAQGVYRGQQAGYPDALKYATMAVYPLVSVAVAGWLSEHPAALRAVPRLLLFILPGLLFAVAAGQSVIPSAYGLYIGVGLAFSTIPQLRWRRLLAWASLAALAVVTAEFAKRGVLLTAVLAWLAAGVAAGKLRQPKVNATIVTAAAAAVAAFAGAWLIESPTRWPLVGGAMTRLSETFNGGQSVAANNVNIRQAFWTYALNTTNAQHPLTGVGAGHPIGVVFGSNDVSGAAIGVHDSFIGYVFYYGWPAGLTAAGLFVWALARAWRLRGQSRYAAALFGAVLAAVSTALTNVALESPYIAGVSWFAVAAVVALPSLGVGVGDVVAADVRQGGRRRRARRRVR